MIVTLVPPRIAMITIHSPTNCVIPQLEDVIRAVMAMVARWEMFALVDCVPQHSMMTAIHALMTPAIPSRDVFTPTKTTTLAVITQFAPR